MKEGIKKTRADALIRRRSSDIIFNFYNGV